MTVIAWDGRYLAVDRQVTYNKVRYEATKLVRLSRSTAVAFSGNSAHAAQLLKWLRDGANPDLWPAGKGDEWARAFVVSRTPNGPVVSNYERGPCPIAIPAPFAAYGDGAHCAVGAMAAGADARSAVRICGQWIEGCGRGVDVFDANPSRRGLRRHSTNREVAKMAKTTKKGGDKGGKGKGGGKKGC